MSILLMELSAVSLMYPKEFIKFIENRGNAYNNQNNNKRTSNT